MLQLVRLFFVILIIACPLVAFGQTPELSAESPITFEAETGMLMAKGDAVYRDKNVQVEADEIRYFRDESRVEATGNVRVTRESLRLITAKLTYDAASGRFESGAFRAGSPPLFIEGNSFEGTLDEIEFSEINAWYREPMSGAPSLKINSGQWSKSDRLQLRGVSLAPPGMNWGVPLPNLEGSAEAPPFSFKSEGGYRNKLGAYLQTETLFPISPRTSLGANFDFYSKRGILFGPILQLQSSPGTTNPWQLSLETGWIRDDQDRDRGLNSLGQPIDADRGFVDLDFKQSFERASAHISAEWQTDTEVWRDFRPDRYWTNPQADIEAEVVIPTNNSILSVYAGIQETEGFSRVERLPEIQWSLLPRPIGQSGALFSASVRATQYRELSIGGSELLNETFWNYETGTWFNPIKPIDRSDFIQQVDLAAEIRRPIHLGKWATLTPKTAIRWIHSSGDPVDLAYGDSSERTLGEIGADLRFRLFRRYNKGFLGEEKNGFTHLLEPIIAYRWMPELSNKTNPFLGSDRPTTSPYAPTIDLNNLRYISAPLEDQHLVRVGIENTFLRNESHDLLGRFAVYSDYLISPDKSENNWDRTYLEMDWRPAPWFAFQYLHAFSTENLRSEAIQIGTKIRSGDIWEARFYGEFLTQQIEEYGVEAMYRFAEAWSAVVLLRYDVFQSQLTEQRYGIRHRVGQTWEWEFYVNLREGDLRQDDFSVGIRLSLLRF